MAELVNMLLQDLGLLTTTPGTFPELLTWIATSTIAAALVAGVFKTFFWVIYYMDQRGGR